MPSPDKVFLKVQQRALDVRERYANSTSEFSNFLITGDYGTGKTQILTTAPRPVFIDCFDPGGTKTAALQPLIASGDIIVENKWETDSWKKPFAYTAWEREMEQRMQEGFFHHIGTYALDSITKFSDSMMYEILKRGTGGKSRKGQQPQLQDYGVQQTTAVDWIGVLMGLPCHVVVTGHIGLIKDEVSGKMETGLLLAGKLSDKVPLSFDEKYITRVTSSSAGLSHKLQTHNDGYYKAETRMGGSGFDLFEEPDLRKLLMKANRNSGDRPGLFGSPEEVTL